MNARARESDDVALATCKMAAVSFDWDQSPLPEVAQEMYGAVQKMIQDSAPPVPREPPPAPSSEENPAPSSEEKRKPKTRRSRAKKKGADEPAQTPEDTPTDTVVASAPELAASAAVATSSDALEGCESEPVTPVPAVESSDASGDPPEASH